MVPSSTTFSAVGGERGAGGGDVDDHLRGAGGRRAFGRARALDDAIVDDAVRGEEVAREIDVFGRHPHLAAVVMAEGGGDVVDVGHGAHVDPGLRHRHHDVGIAEAEALDQHHALVGVRHLLAHQVFAGDAEMDGALRELAGDFGGRQIRDLDAVEAGDGAAIVARAARLDQREPGAREESFGVFLQPALGRHGEHQRRTHDAPP